MLVRNYIAVEHIEIMLSYAREVYNPKSEVLFLPASAYRKRPTIFKVPDVIYDTMNRIIKDFDLQDYKNTVDIFFNRLFEKQSVARHIHIQHDNGDDLRFNIMLQRSDYGGVPTCDGKTYNLKNGDMWIFNGNRDHETDVVGGKDRYVISYGFIVKKQKVDELLNSSKKNNLFFL
jgi:hypothetical protein